LNLFAGAQLASVQGHSHLELAAAPFGLSLASIASMVHQNSLPCQGSSHGITCPTEGERARI